MNNGIEYPEINFWNREAEKLVFVNPEDFRREKLLVALGLDRACFKDVCKTFGITERDEIVKRQKLVRFFIENSAIADFLKKISLDVTNLPMSGQHFLDYFSPESEHNPFWNLMCNFVGAVEQSQDVPAEIVSLVKFLKRTANLEGEERKMAKNIALEIQRAVHIEGVIKYSLDYDALWRGFSEENIKGGEAYGYQKYAFGYRTLRKVPEWVEKNVCRWTGIKYLAELCIAGINASIKRRYFSPYIIRLVPDVISQSITNFLGTRINNLKLPEQPKGKGVGISFSVFFRYSERGLEIGLLNVDAWRKEKYEPVASNFLQYDKEIFPGYSRRELRAMKSSSIAQNNSVDALRIKQFGADIANRMKEKVFDGRDTITISGEDVDNDYKWVSLPALYKQTAFETTYKVIQEYREYVRGQLETLKVIAQLAHVFSEKAREWNKPLCFPKILKDHEHIVSFETLEPIHLIGESKSDSLEKLTAEELVSIKSLSQLNRLIGFTGQNAGGKSTTEEAIVNALFLAQSGLPVFGEKFSLNIKSQIGMVFIERGSGSTLELLLRKTKNILESLNGTSENKVVLVLDEVGTGTQEIDGFVFGKKLLRKLADSKCSVIFSTQIVDLAKYAKDTLGAECFNFNLQHEITPGIGRGGIENLMSEIGVDKLLN